MRYCFSTDFILYGFNRKCSESPNLVTLLRDTCSKDDYLRIMVAVEV